VNSLKEHSKEDKTRSDNTKDGWLGEHELADIEQDFNTQVDSRLKQNEDQLD
jgi:hypothetical protein